MMLARRLASYLANNYATVYWSYVLRTKCIAQRGIYIRDPRRIRIGGNVHLGERMVVVSETSAGTLNIGDNVTIAWGVRLDISGDLSIGRGTLISPEVMILTHAHPGNPKAKPVGMRKEVGEDVWIGMRAIILENAQCIGSGAVIGAGAVVTKNVPDNAIVAGNPAVQIGWRQRDQR